MFGPWERATGVRDTLSPHCQILAAAVAGQEAVLARPGLRDWLFAPDLAEAVLRVATAPQLAHKLYNVSTGQRFSATQSSLKGGTRGGAGAEGGPWQPRGRCSLAIQCH